MLLSDLTEMINHLKEYDPAAAESFQVDLEELGDPTVYHGLVEEMAIEVSRKLAMYEE